MANQSGSVYGLTILSPIADKTRGEDSPALAIRKYLAHLPIDENSPFAKVSSTHMARLVVMDDVVFVGSPAHEEHLRSQYLIFESNFDGELDDYLKRMAQEIPEHVDAVWTHCVGYPGVRNVDAFAAYMKKCQLTTTFYFADVNNKTVQQTLQALATQKALADFMEENQGKPAAELQASFAELVAQLGSAPAPEPGRRRLVEMKLSRKAAPR
jgi:hypothetical protein